MSTCPPAERAFQAESISSTLPKLAKKDTAGENAKCGPPLSATNFCPQSSVEVCGLFGLVIEPEVGSNSSHLEPWRKVIDKTMDIVKGACDNEKSPGAMADDPGGEQ
jgi:hypothetical protein